MIIFSTRRLGAAAAFASTLALASTASAATVTSVFGAPDPGPGVNQTFIIDFNSGLPSGVTLTGQAAIVTGTTGTHAIPAGEASNDPYLVVPDSGPSGTAILTFDSALNSDIKSFSLYWGSIDTYNTLYLLDGLGNSFFSFNGASIPFSPADGNQFNGNTNQRVNFVLGPGETLGGLKFVSNGIAFEVDNIALEAPINDNGGGIPGVPEPATWAMMLVGMFGLGAILRSARRSNAIVA